MATNNAVNTNLSGQTGTGNFVGATSPTLITPNIGVATATSLVFSPTTNGIIGTTTNNNAPAGSVGEVISSTVLDASAVDVPNLTATAVTSISLTPGDWDVFGNIFATFSASTGSQAYSWIGNGGFGFPDNSQIAGAGFNSNVATGIGIATLTNRISLSVTTTIYLCAYTAFPAGTSKASGNIIARRRR